MKKAETAADFYQAKGITRHGDTSFNVFENDAFCGEPHVFSRRDYFKISLLLGKGRISWQDKVITIDRPALFFFNPQAPFSWEPLDTEQPGYFCIFKKAFLQEHDRQESLRQSPLLQPGHHPVFFPDTQQVQYMTDIFRRMLHDFRSDYAYKYELLQQYLLLLIHEALKMKPEGINRPRSAKERITGLFTELLNRQFPIESPSQSLQLKTAGDYARELSLHVNHLNHAVREVTGKPTSAHIADRILTEANALLRHTDWQVSAIANALGFEYPNYFYNFYKKKTGHAPGQSRAAIL